MLQFGNKEFRNLQEQVLKNMRDIQDIMEGTTVLADFGIKVVGEVTQASDLPNPLTYLEEGGEYGDAYVVGTEEPYEYYIFTRAFEGEEEPHWFDLGIFPQPGPQGPQGEQGPIGLTPVISAAANAETLNSGQSATASVSKSGTSAAPTFTFTFGIPQGIQGIQGIQGPQGIQGERGPQGIQGQKGDPGYLYTIVGQVNDSAHLPLPTEVRRDSAFLVGTQEPYDVYVIIGETEQELEWINLGEIATVEPMTFVASDTYEESGTLDPSILASITALTDIHYLRDGDILFQRASVLNGSAYYTSIGVTGSGTTEIGYLIVDLTDGSWEVEANVMPTDVSNYVTTNTAQTITGKKTFSDSIQLGSSQYNYISLVNGAPFISSNTGAISTNGNILPSGNGTKDLGSNSLNWKDLYLTGNAYLGNTDHYIRKGSGNVVEIGANGATILTLGSSSSAINSVFRANGDNVKDLGQPTVRWKNLYLSGNISDGTNSMSVADISNLSNSTFNIIDANDIVDSTLTQTQYDLITNGKPTRVIGTLFNLKNPIISTGAVSGNYYVAKVEGFNSGSYVYDIGSIVIHTSTKVISYQSENSSTISLRSVYRVNGKTLPVYPTTNTNPQVLTIAANGGSLAWTDKPVVPTDISAFTNDSGYITSSYHDSSKLDASMCTLQTTAPSAAITDGGVHIVYLTSEPATKYSGYIYLIKE